jgi:iron complex transport system substrate-binding protein
MSETRAPSRRRFITTTCAAVGGAALAGCQSGTAPEESPTGDGETGPYTVEMAPVGEVQFESVPQSWSTYFPGYADMGVALGQADGLHAVGNKGRYHTDVYAELDGVTVDKSSLEQTLGDGGIDREVYLELDDDVFLTDPRWLTNNSYFGLEQKDIEDISETVAPFIGNTIFRRTDDWHEYRYYTMYEAFETVAEVFQQTDRFEQFQSFHDEVLGRVDGKLPSASERPNALLTFAASDEPETFSPYRLSDEGTNKKQFHDLGLADALAGTGIEGLSTTDRGKIDYETMLEVDPDVLLVRGHEDKSADEFESKVLGFMREHSVASDLTAVQNGQVFRGGPIYQGPIMHLFNLERAATDVYPDTFTGELFDRDELADIVTG